MQARWGFGGPGAVGVWLAVEAHNGKISQTLIVGPLPSIDLVDASVASVTAQVEQTGSKVTRVDIVEGVLVLAGAAHPLTLALQADARAVEEFDAECVD